MRKKLSSAWLSAVILAEDGGTSAPVAPAQTAQTVENINLKPGFWTTIEGLTIPTLISALIKFILIVAAVVFFFMLVIGGIQWIVSGGDKTATEGARNKITAALVGLLIVFSAWAIAQLISAFFKINIFSLTPPTI